MLSRCCFVEAGGISGGAAFGGTGSGFEILRVVDSGCEVLGGALGDIASVAGFSDLMDVISLDIQLVGILASGPPCASIVAAMGAASGVANAVGISVL